MNSRTNKGYTKIRHDDAVHGSVYLRAGILDVLDVLDHDNSAPVLAQARDVGPRLYEYGKCPGGPHAATRCQVDATRACSSPAAERIQVEQKVWALVTPGHSTIATHPLNQDRVKHADLHADAHYEGHVGSVEVVWRQPRRCLV